MDFSKLSYSQVLEHAGTLNTSATRMGDILEQLRAQFNKVGNDDVWSGTAAAEAKSAFDALAARFPEFQQAVQDCSTHLQSVVSNYQSVDQVVTGQ